VEEVDDVDERNDPRLGISESRWEAEVVVMMLWFVEHRCWLRPRTPPITIGENRNPSTDTAIAEVEYAIDRGASRRTIVFQ
jgi:hypothetical protein